MEVDFLGGVPHMKCICCQSNVRRQFDGFLHQHETLSTQLPCTVPALFQKTVWVFLGELFEKEFSHFLVIFILWMVNFPIQIHFLGLRIYGCTAPCILTEFLNVKLFARANLCWQILREILTTQFCNKSPNIVTLLL